MQLDIFQEKQSSLVNITEEIELINQKYPLFYVDDFEKSGVDRQEYENSKYFEVAKLWGFKELVVNSCGWADFRFDNIEEIDLPPDKKGYVSLSYIRVGQAPNKRWTYATSLSMYHSGYVHPLSIFNTMQFNTKEDAVRAGIKELKGKIPTDDSYGKKLIKFLDSLLYQLRIK